MAGVLHRFPLPWDDPRIQELHAVLATGIYRESEIEPLVIAAGVPPADIAWNTPSRQLWYEAMKLAARYQILPVLVNQAVERFPALRQRVEQLLADKPVLRAPMPRSDPLVLAAKDTRWLNFSASSNHERRIVEGQDTMLDIAFLQHGLDRARAVCLLTVTFDGDICYGTGFRIGSRTLLTNHHVLNDWEHAGKPASSVVAAFGYEIDVRGRLRTATRIQCDVTTIRGDRNHDFGIIMADATLPDDTTVLPLDPAATVAEDDRVYIVQHPEGLPKKIALAHNLVRYADADVVQYWTDTEAGSSGSPVFDEKWRVVALHHQWVESPEGDGLAFRNQGRSIGKIVERMAALGIERDR
jgi:V8-like Glu-specific endopeptidase